MDLRLLTFVAQCIRWLYEHAHSMQWWVHEGNFMHLLTWQRSGSLMPSG